MNTPENITQRPTLEEAIRAVVDRMPFAGARVGIAAHDIAGGKPLYECNATALFPGASTTKILTCAYALELLGADFRFRTRCVRSGELDDEGTLHGDLVLVASGDPNLSGRVTASDTLDFENPDYSNVSASAQVVERDPLQVIRTLAQGAHDAGIRRVTGTVLVNIDLFPEGRGDTDIGAVISPVSVNDNLIDVEVTAGKSLGDSLSYRMSPASGYVRLIDRARTGESTSEPALRFSREQCEADGTWSVIATGTVPAGKKIRSSLAVESPSRFVRTLLVEALAAVGVVVEGALFGPSVTTATLPDATGVAEHISPPLAETTKVVLKVSQNLHAEMLIPLIGATLQGAHGVAARAAGYGCCADLLTRWDIDTTGLFQGDACGAYGHFSPDFMCRLLVRIAASDIFDALAYGLPRMGRDGTLWDIQPQSNAAGHVLGKTGTFALVDPLKGDTLFTCKGLAGYLTAKSGLRVAFTIYLNNVLCTPASNVAPGQLVGEIATVLYEYL